MTEWTAYAYNAAAFLGVVLLVIVMQKTERDHNNSKDHPVVRAMRRAGFIFSSLVLLITIGAEWNKSVPVLLLLLAGDFNLGINAVALHMRRPPDKGSKIRLPQFLANRQKTFHAAYLRDDHRE